MIVKSIRVLLESVDYIENENKKMKSKIANLEKESKNQQRYTKQLELELKNIANLYSANQSKPDKELTQLYAKSEIYLPKEKIKSLYSTPNVYTFSQNLLMLICTVSDIYRRYLSTSIDENQKDKIQFSSNLFNEILNAAKSNYFTVDTINDEFVKEVKTAISNRLNDLNLVFEKMIKLERMSLSEFIQGHGLNESDLDSIVDIERYKNDKSLFKVLDDSVEKQMNSNGNNQLDQTINVNEGVFLLKLKNIGHLNLHDRADLSPFFDKL